MNYNKYNSELRKIMKVYSYKILRKNKHIIWVNAETGERFVTSASPSDVNTLKRIKKRLEKQLVRS